MQHCGSGNRRRVDCRRTRTSKRPRSSSRLRSGCSSRGVSQRRRCRQIRSKTSHRAFFSCIPYLMRSTLTPDYARPLRFIVQTPRSRRWSPILAHVRRPGRSAGARRPRTHIALGHADDRFPVVRFWSGVGVGRGEEGPGRGEGARGSERGQVGSPGDRDAAEGPVERARRAFGFCGNEPPSSTRVPREDHRRVRESRRRSALGSHSSGVESSSPSLLSSSKSLIHPGLSRTRVNSLLARE